MSSTTKRKKRLANRKKTGRKIKEKFIEIYVKLTCGCCTDVLYFRSMESFEQALRKCDRSGMPISIAITDEKNRCVDGIDFFYGFSLSEKEQSAKSLVYLGTILNSIAESSQIYKPQEGKTVLCEFCGEEITVPDKLKNFGQWYLCFSCQATYFAGTKEKTPGAIQLFKKCSNSTDLDIITKSISDLDFDDSEAIKKEDYDLYFIKTKKEEK